MEFYPLKIKQLTPETSDTVTIEFDVAPELTDVFQFKQGQFITLRLHINDHEVRRSYSMSSSPTENKLAVTVKKVPGGKASTYLTEKAKVGDSIDCAPPDGRFFSKLEPEKRRTYYMFASGSGITPIISIAKTVLEEEPMSTVYLLYGNRTEETRSR